MAAAMQGGVHWSCRNFSNAMDVAKMMQLYLQRYGNQRYFSAATIGFQYLFIFVLMMELKRVWALIKTGLTALLVNTLLHRVLVIPVYRRYGLGEILKKWDCLYPFCRIELILKLSKLEYTSAKENIREDIQK
jgi:hypothetical protein